MKNAAIKQTSMASAARRQIIGGSAPTIKHLRRCGSNHVR